MALGVVFNMRNFFFCMMMAVLSFSSLAEAAAKKEDSGEGQYVKMQPLLLPIIDEDGVQQVVSMVVAIEVMGSVNADKVKAMKPKLADAYIQNMYGILNKHAALKGGVIQVKMIKAKLNSITTDIIGHDIESDVLLQVVQQRPI